jgi:transcriptional regulator with XRE-family HTH domain
MKKTKAYSLRELRLEKGLTLQQVEEKTGVALGTIQALETGRGKNYNIVIKQTLADFYELPLRELFPELQILFEELQGKRHQVQMFFNNEEPKKD